MILLLYYSSCCCRHGWGRSLYQAPRMSLAPLHLRHRFILSHRIPTIGCSSMARMRRAALILLGCAILVELAAGHGGRSDDGAYGAATRVHLRAKGLILVKVYCLVIVFVTTLLTGVSPYFFRWHSTFLVLGTQYAGGVFLATALLHFLSDSHNVFQELTTREYAFAELLAIAGYIVTMLGELVIQRVALRATLQLAEKLDRGGVCSCTAEENGFCKSGAGGEIPEVMRRTSAGDAFVLILALCFHSIFEGIAIGVAETKRNAWRALWTISIHKAFAGIAMGIALLRMLPNRPFLSCLSYAFAFAISTPVGVAIGIVIDSTAQGAAADWVYAVSMGSAAGVFIYVAINHLLAKGYVPPSATALDEPFYKFLAVVLGAATIAIVMIWDT